jgi:hypothetical protein
MVLVENKCTDAAQSVVKATAPKFICSNCIIHSQGLDVKKSLNVMKVVSNDTEKAKKVINSRPLNS